MSYIHCYNNNYYKPSENLTNLFEEQVIQPFEDNLPELAADVENKRRFYWDDIARILGQGQSNFDQKSFDEPSNRYYYPKDKVSIYCVHYMPMHLFSSYYVFTNCLTSISKSDKIVFIDFGCGPLTSGIAFWAFAGQNDITYFGIDSSQTMLDKAVEINEYGPYGKGPFFSKFKTIHDYDYLLGLLDGCIVQGSRTWIVFNFSYFFASPSLDVNNLSRVVIQIVEKYSQCSIYIVYQNAVSSSLELRKKWYTFKDNLLKVKTSKFRSRVPSDRHIQLFKYNRLINQTCHDNAKVYSDILCNDNE